MAIRLRIIDGTPIALCAVETDPVPNDIYLDDGFHYGLAAKFAQDWQGQMVDWSYPPEWSAMETQKKRDAKEEHEKWAKEQPPTKTTGNK